MTKKETKDTITQAVAQAVAPYNANAEVISTIVTNLLNTEAFKAMGDVRPTNAIEVIEQINEIVESRLEEYKETHIKAALATVAAKAAEDKAAATLERQKNSFEHDIAINKLVEETKEVSKKLRDGHKEDIYNLNEIIGDRNIQIKNNDKEIKKLKAKLKESNEEYLLDLIDQVKDFAAYTREDVKCMINNSWTKKDVQIPCSTIAKAFKSTLIANGIISGT